MGHTDVGTFDGMHSAGMLGEVSEIMGKQWLQETSGPPRECGDCNLTEETSWPGSLSRQLSSGFHLSFAIFASSGIFFPLADLRLLPQKQMLSSKEHLHGGLRRQAFPQALQKPPPWTREEKFLQDTVPKPLVRADT